MKIARNGSRYAPLTELKTEAISVDMMRSVRIALVVVVILSVAYVLITPDPTDDVDGVLRTTHPLTPQKLVAASLPQPQIPIIVIFQLLVSPICTQRLDALELLDLVCVCRC